jgi:hypothetical protein
MRNFSSIEHLGYYYEYYNIDAVSVLIMEIIGGEL